MLSLHIPPLRDRTVEIPLLFRHFLDKYNEKFRKNAPAPPAHLLEAATRYRWPGNLRELENFVKRYVILEDSEGSFRELLGTANAQGEIAPQQRPTATKQGLKALVRNLKQEAEREAIVEALAKSNGRRKDAARMLGISYKALLYKMRQFHLEPATKQLQQPLAARQPGRVGKGHRAKPARFGMLHYRNGAVESGSQKTLSRAFQRGRRHKAGKQPSFLVHFKKVNKGAPRDWSGGWSNPLSF